MTRLHFDSLGGASGDMILATLLDLGVEPAAVEQALSGLGVGPFRLETRTALDHGIRGLRLRVIEPDAPAKQPPPAHSHGAGLGRILHALRPHSHGHGHTHTPAEHGQPHRGLPEIEAILNQATLPEPVRAGSLDVFRRLATVEARMHDTTPDKVHFHEVGALDAIADIVGAHVALNLLGVSGVTVGPLPIGGGTITCAHGTLPLPAPATAELLRGMPVFRVEEDGETVTPTGAALFSAWRTGSEWPAGAWQRVGHGLGGRTWKSRPNLLRAFLFEETADAAPAGGGRDTCLVLECNLDDLSPELVGSLSAKLLAQGALDAFTIPVFMKKQRPGILLTVLCKPTDRDGLLDTLFRESTTFGVRERLENRTILERRFETVQTPYGPVRVKIGIWKGAVASASPEFADCAAQAEKNGVPVKTVNQAAASAYAAAHAG